MTYNCNFDEKRCQCDAVINEKIYDINIGGGIEVWMENIVQLASGWKICKAGISLLEMLSY